ncbi:MAG: hypothetical protein C4308_14190 [Chitinophagaceae bacterium]
MNRYITFKNIVIAFLAIVIIILLFLVFHKPKENAEVAKYEKVIAYKDSLLKEKQRQEVLLENWKAENTLLMERLQKENENLRSQNEAIQKRLQSLKTEYEKIPINVRNLSNDSLRSAIQRKYGDLPSENNGY